MNINSRIKWQVGLELTEQTFRGHDSALEGRIAVLRSALNCGVFGLLPDSDYHCHPTFVKRNLEISNLRCMALLRSGDIIHIDESVEVAITMLYEDVYFVAVELDEQNLIDFDHEGVPMVRPSNKFSVVTPAQLSERLTQHPIVKLRQNNGSFQIDTEYIPPVIMVGSSVQVMDLVKRMKQSMESIINHSNLEPGEATLSLRRLYFNLKSVDERSLMGDLITLLSQILGAIDYYICKPNGLKSSELYSALDRNDIGPWLMGVVKFVEWIVGAMDGVVLEDRSIDYEKLKSEIYLQLTETVRDQMYKQMYEELSVALREEIARDVKSPLMSFINGEVRRELYADLFKVLMKDLSEKLNPELYDKLYEALHVEEEKVEDEFVPLI